MSRLDPRRAWDIIAPMQRLRATVLALSGVGMMAGGCTDVAGPEEPLSGRQIYERHCARCHGSDGRPTPASPTARDLTNRSYVEGLGNRQIKATIMAGVPAGVPPDQQRMPAFGNQFSEPELEVLIGHVRSLSNPELGPDRLTPKAVGGQQRQRPTVSRER
jgi:mono/diheme cytochrome c family protein